jgi:hypothetical protein
MDAEGRECSEKNEDEETEADEEEETGVFVTEDTEL